MTTPPPYAVAYSAAYNAGSDSYQFTFSSYYPIVSVPRVDFSYVDNVSVPGVVTFFSSINTSNGVTVAWDLCSSPVGTSAADLYNKILALYTGGGGGGTVTSVTGGTGITVTGTATDPVVNNAGVIGVTAGTNITLGGTAANPVINATGGGGGTVTSVTAGTGLTDTGTATDPVLNIADTGAGAGSTTLSSLTRNAQGQVTAAANGTGAQINAALGYTAANVAAVVNTITAGTGITLGGTATNRIINATVTSIPSAIFCNSIGTSPGYIGNFTNTDHPFNLNLQAHTSDLVQSGTDIQYTGATTKSFWVVCNIQCLGNVVAGDGLSIYFLVNGVRVSPVTGEYRTQFTTTTGGYLYSNFNGSSIVTLNTNDTFNITVHLDGSSGSLIGPSGYSYISLQSAV